MPLNQTHLFWAKVWLSVLAGVAVTGIMYALLIHPSVVLVAQRESAREARTSAEQDYLRAVSALKSIQTRILDKSGRLEALGGSPPPETQEDIIVTSLTNMAVMDGITIEQFAPLDTLDAEDHRAFFVQFMGSGKFTDLYRYLKRVESQVDFVDITHLSISRSTRHPEDTCLIQWSCRINTQKISNESKVQRVFDKSIAFNVTQREGRGAK